MHTTLPNGQLIAGYRIESLIAGGGMAVVYRAHDLALGRDVALKLLAPDVAQSDTFRKRFIRESEMASSLDHPNIIPIYDAGAVDGVLYIAMRYVPGPTLQTVLEQTGPLAIDRALSLFAQVASALDSAHAHGLVHRDVKPHNILVAPPEERGLHEHAYLTDFGLTKRTASLSGLTSIGNFLGTIDYIAPEQITGESVSPRTDVYALGCVIFQALTGAVPFQREHDAAVIYAHLNDPPPSARALRPDLPAEVDAVLRESLAKAPEDRYSSCCELVTALRRAASPGSLGEETLPVASDAPTRLSRSPLAPAVVEGDQPDTVTTFDIWARPQEPLPGGDELTMVGSGSRPEGPGAPGVVRHRSSRTAAGSSRRGLILVAALVGVLGVVAAAVLILTRSSSVAPSVALPFAVESYPDKGIDVSRTWVLDGRKGDHLHGELVIVSRRATPTSFDEVLPKEMVSSARRVNFTPAPDKIVRDDPIVAFTATRSGSQTFSYDVPVAPGSVTLVRLQQWAADQQRERNAFLQATGQPLPVTLASLSMSPQTLVLVAGGPPHLVQLSGRNTNGTAATPASLAKAIFGVDHPKVATVDGRGAVRPLSAGQALVTARLGALSASTTVLVADVPKAGKVPVPTSTLGGRPSVLPTAGPTSGGSPTPTGTRTTPPPTTTTPDTTAPTVTITRPRDGTTYTEGTAVTARYSCADETGGSGLGSCVGDVPNGSPIDMAVGSHTFTVNAADNAGNTATKTASYTVLAKPVDNTDPTVSITTPGDGATYTEGETVSAAYSCADEEGGSGLASCEGTVPDGSPIDMTVGSHTFTVNATDNAGNTGSKSVRYTVAPRDTTPPTIDLTTPSDGATYTEGETVNAAYSCADEAGGSGLASCVGTVPNGSPIDTTAGSHTFTVTAKDNAGNESTTSATYTVQPPPSSAPPPSARSDATPTVPAALPAHQRWLLWL